MYSLRRSERKIFIVCVWLSHNVSEELFSLSN